MGFNEVLSSWSSSEEEDGHDHDEDRDQVFPNPFNTTCTIGPLSLHSKRVLRKILQQTIKVSQQTTTVSQHLFAVKLHDRSAILNISACI